MFYIFLCFKLIFFSVFLNYFDALMLKKNLKIKKYIILIYFLNKKYFLKKLQIYFFKKTFK